MRKEDLSEICVAFLLFGSFIFLFYSLSLVG
ncbi:hypothetical protein C826_00470 [Helicobacter bilis WiWa]|uniref:Uncharacterized protein n=1 Tax=Helicobacter bilis WiWa TaxID=1235804 RepID=N2BSJ4_9HELI|nr:hypothetical protein C826_00470 [Helicobacter bilis WiWa]